MHSYARRFFYLVARGCLPWKTSILVGSFSEYEAEAVKLSYLSIPAYDMRWERDSELYDDEEKRRMKEEPQTLLQSTVIPTARKVMTKKKKIRVSYEMFLENRQAVLQCVSRNTLYLMPPPP